MFHKALQNQYLRVLIAVFANLINAVGINLFIVPMGLYSDGVLGMCQVIRTVLVQTLDLPGTMDFSGILYFIVNIPLLFLAWRALGKGFLARTLICVASSSFFLSIIHSPATALLSDRLTSCMLGGIICGFSLGLMLTCGCSSGGLDILGLWLSKKGSGFTVGRFSIEFNVVLYAVCAILFDIQTVIYSVIYMVISSLVMDRAHQQSITVQVLIFTKEDDPELPHSIMTKLHRGVTYWEGKGAYTDSDVRVLCVCVSKFEVSALEEILHELDPRAFFIVQEGVRIGGNFVRRIS